MSLTDLSPGFRLSLPQNIPVPVQAGHVFGLIGGKKLDLAINLPLMARNYLEAVRVQVPFEDFFWDYHIGEPAFIGGTFLYRHKANLFRHWLWTERSEVELPSLALATAASRQAISGGVVAA